MIKREPGDLRQTITHRITQRFFVRWHMAAILVCVMLSGVVCSALLLRSMPWQGGDETLHRRIETAGPDELARFSEGSRVAHGERGALLRGASAGRAENHGLTQLM